MAKPSTEVAVSEPEFLPAELADLEAQLVGQNQAEVDVEDIQIPMLKIGQALTPEVEEGEANAGEFINSLTRQGLGDEVEFVVASYQKGRFKHGDRKKGERARKAYGTKNVPWPEDPFYGKPFSEHPDAEEQYKIRVNNKEIEWGKGPKISTTHDFTGYVISGLEEGEEPIPVCLSLKRTQVPAAKKWSTILNAVLRGRFWDSTFILTTERKGFTEGSAYILQVKQGRKTTQSEKIKALELAKVVSEGRAQTVGDEDEGGATRARPVETEDSVDI